MACSKGAHGTFVDWQFDGNASQQVLHVCEIMSHIQLRNPWDEMWCTAMWCFYVAMTITGERVTCFPSEGIRGVNVLM